VLPLWKRRIWKKYTPTFEEAKFRSHFGEDIYYLDPEVVSEGEYERFVDDILNSKHLGDIAKGKMYHEISLGELRGMRVGSWDSHDGQIILSEKPYNLKGRKEFSEDVKSKRELVEWIESTTSKLPFIPASVFEEFKDMIKGYGEVNQWEESSLSDGLGKMNMYWLNQSMNSMQNF
jgi:hypothetical protein